MFFLIDCLICFLFIIIGVVVFCLFKLALLLPLFYGLILGIIGLVVVALEIIVIREWFKMIFTK